MLVWLNGAFGSGKTTLAEALHAHLPGSVILDPEEIGCWLREMVPPTPSGDFQDLAIWRELVVETAAALARNYPSSTIIVPMTVVDLAYVDEMHGRIRESGTPVLHVWLTVPAEILGERIRRQTIDPDPVRDREIATWRLGQVGRCVAAEAGLDGDVVRLDGARPIGVLVRGVVGVLAAVASGVG